MTDPTTPQETATQTYESLREERDALRRDLDELTRRCDELIANHAEYVAGKVGIKEMYARNGKMTMTMHTEMAAILGDSLAAMLDGADAKNYVEMSLRASDGKPYTVLVRREERPTPHELRVAADAERDKWMETAFAQTKIAMAQTEVVADLNAQLANQAEIITSLRGQLNTALAESILMEETLRGNITPEQLREQIGEGR